MMNDNASRKHNKITKVEYGLKKADGDISFDDDRERTTNAGIIQTTMSTMKKSTVLKKRKQIRRENLM